jgi:hypothetical protein
LLATSNVWRRAKEDVATSTKPIGHTILCLGITLYVYFIICALAQNGYFSASSVYTSDEIIIVIAGVLIIICACICAATFVALIVFIAVCGHIPRVNASKPQFTTSGITISKPIPVSGTSGSTSLSQSTQTQVSASSPQTRTSSGSRPTQHANYIPSLQNSRNLTSTLGTQPSLINMSEDFILLCFRIGTYLTKRHDINVSGMTQDRELFAAFRAQYKAYFRWTQRNLGLWTVKNITFVKVHTSAVSFCCVYLGRSSS